tara:strand:+ start:711 stop:1178 length:468 start_codon:yes stop_codon:yes gene_type:complete
MDVSYYKINNPVNQAWGEWLSGLATWDWWVTLTFRDPPIGTPGWTRPGFATAKRGWRDFVGLLQAGIYRSDEQLKWFRAFEIQRWRGAPHIHALVGGLGEKRYLPAGNFWLLNYGYSKIEEYDKSLGAGYYLSKYVTKELGDMDWGGLTTVEGSC